MAETVSDRPTFEQAFSASEGTAADSLPATPATDSSQTDSASAPATGAPAATEAATDVHPGTEDQGPIPVDRHKAILEHARTEARDKAVAEWRQQYGWAEQVPREQLQTMNDWYQRAAQDPVAFALDLVDELSADQSHAPALRSHAARLLRAARAQSPEADITPDIPVMDAQGQVVSQAFSADRVKQLIAREVAKAVNPLNEDKKTREDREHHETYQRELQQFTKRESSRIRASVESRPHAKEHWQAIVAKAQTYPEDIPVGEALRDAYYDVVGPLLTDRAKSEVLDTLKTKAAAASGSVNPAGAAIASSKRPASFFDPNLQW